MIEPDPRRWSRQDESGFQFGNEVREAIEENDQQRLDELAAKYKRRNKNARDSK